VESTNDHMDFSGPTIDPVFRSTAKRDPMSQGDGRSLGVAIFPDEELFAAMKH
jgi:hypothetical protein